MDPFTGAHIKFRLGGLHFPPTIYYKIFVHTPLVDLGAFSPRDYTKEAKQILPLFLFNKSKGVEPQEVKEIVNHLQIGNPPIMRSHASVKCKYRTDGWYQRIENNGWRPISDKVSQTLNVLFLMQT